MDTLWQVTASAAASRNIVEYAKEKGWLKNRLELNLASFVINGVCLFLFSLIEAAYTGQSLNYGIIKTAAAYTLTALYADFKKSLKSA